MQEVRLLRREGAVQLAGEEEGGQWRGGEGEKGDEDEGLAEVLLKKSV